MPKIDSSMIVSVEYDRAARELLILFTSGKTYAYSDVPQTVYRGLLKAQSKGRYFLDCIEGQYSYAPVRRRRSA